MELQHYNSNDLTVRTAVAACAIGCKSAAYAKKWRYGSITYCEQKNLEIAVNQLNIIRKFNLLLLPATSKVTITGDGSTNVSSVIRVNGITISNGFLYTTDNTTTAEIIADAINDFTSTPDYTATVNGSVVTITAKTKGDDPNGWAVTQVGGDVTISAEFMTGGQDGVEPEDNIITEEQLEHMFNNIAKFTGCCYAPLGYGYESAVDTSKLGLALTLNTGTDVTLNTGDIVRLNKKI